MIKSEPVLPPDPLLTDAPVLLLGRANTYEDPRRLKQVLQECERIEELFTTTQATHFRLINTKPEEGSFLFDQLRKFRFQPSLRILHIAGFSVGDHLHLEGGWGEEPMKPKEVAQLLGRLPGLQVLFLNGCGTPALLEALLPLQIPAIILTAEIQNRGGSQEIAHAFYGELARGSSIEKALQVVESTYPHLFLQKRVFYQLEQDRFIWDGKTRVSNKQEVEWGAYLLQESLPELAWAFPPSLPTTELLTPETVVRKRRIKQIGTTIFALGLLGILLVGLWKNQGWKQWLPDWKESCEFSDAAAFHLIQLPFQEQDNCEFSDPFYAESIQRRLQQLGDGYEYYYQTVDDCLLDPRKVQSRFQACNPDMVLWGTYAFSQAQAATLSLQYLYDPVESELTYGKMELSMPLHLFDQKNDFIPSAVEEVVFWVRGMRQYEQGEYGQAQSWFQKILPREDLAYLKVDQQLARCYEQLQEYAQAKRHYDHMLRIAPDSAMSWYGRGNAQARLNNYPDALLDLSQAIELHKDFAEAYHSRALLSLRTNQLPGALADGKILLDLRPEDRKTHGLLAAIYAQMEDKTSLLYHFEKALSYGLQADRYLTSLPALQAYEHDPEFKALLKKYP